MDKELIVVKPDIYIRTKVYYSNTRNVFYIRYKNKILDIDNKLLRFESTIMYANKNNTKHTLWYESRKLKTNLNPLVFDYWCPIKPDTTITVYINNDLQITLVLC